MTAASAARKTLRHPTMLIAVGASAGGLAVLGAIAARLPSGFPGALLVVRHLATHASNEAAIRALRSRGPLPCADARHGESIAAGHIYLAPPDRHLMVADGKILLTRGAPENRARPAIDPLFRSAAVEYGNRAVGVVLSGYLDDGTAGLETIRSCGGVCVVQDPDDAEYPEMPRNAMQHVLVDFCLPAAELGALLSELALREPGQRSAVPDDVAVEAAVAKRVLSDLEAVESLGQQVPFNCPGCGGVLWQISKSNELRFRCHTGHAYTAAALLAEQTEKMEETMWVALRMFEEHRNLLLRMNAEGSANSSSAERLEQLRLHIQRIRAMLRSTGGWK